jgi:hypothetical protein
MKRLLLLGGWAVAGVAAVPQLICGLGDQPAGPVSPPGDGRADVHAQADNRENGLQLRADDRGIRNGRAGTAVRIHSSSGAVDGPAAVSDSTGGGGNGGGCANRGLQLSGDADAGGTVQKNDPDADGDGVANANLGPRCEPGIGVDVTGSGNADS